MAQPTPAPQPAPQAAPIVGNHTLPSGAVVTFIDAEDLTGDDVQVVLDGLQMSADDLDGDSFRGSAGQAMRFAAAVTARLIEAWQVPYLPDAPPPAQDPAMLGKLKARDYAAAIKAAAPAVQLFMGDAPAVVDDAMVPGSPTGPASG